MVEGSGLENRRRRKPSVGSNPTCSSNPNKLRYMTNHLQVQPGQGQMSYEYAVLQEAAEIVGWTSSQSWRPHSTGKIIPYGSQLFVEVIAEQAGISVFSPTFDWLALVPPAYLKRRVRAMPFKEVAAYIRDVPMFAKPADLKSFDAKIYTASTLPSVDADIPCLVSDVMDFTYEYRAFVKQGVPLTWSNYLYEGQVNNCTFWRTLPPGCTETPVDFISEFSTTEDTCVIDIGWTSSGWAVIEANPACCSGLYGCDPLKVLQVLDSCVTKTE